MLLLTECFAYTEALGLEVEDSFFDPLFESDEPDEPPPEHGLPLDLIPPKKPVEPSQNVMSSPTFFWMISKAIVD